MSYTPPPPPGPDNHVIAWDKNGPIEVEMIVVSAGKFSVKGPTAVEGRPEPAKTFHGMQWIT